MAARFLRRTIEQRIEEDSTPELRDAPSDGRALQEFMESGQRRCCEGALWGKRADGHTSMLQTMRLPKDPQGKQ